MVFDLMASAEGAKPKADPKPPRVYGGAASWDTRPKPSSSPDTMGAHKFNLSEWLPTSDRSFETIVRTGTALSRSKVCVLNEQHATRRLGLHHAQTSEERQHDHTLRTTCCYRGQRRQAGEAAHQQ